MSEARDAIFERLAAAQPPAGAQPSRLSPPPMPTDPEAILRARIETAGGRLQSAQRATWPSEIEWPIDLAGVQHLHCREPALRARGVGANPRRLRDLAPLEVCVLRAEFAVVENGAAWQIPASPLERAAALLAEHLLILVDAAALVPTLHQAYQRIDLRDLRFGWFLCGPSKTADIEQALVLGAHGPRTMSLVLIRD